MNKRILSGLAMLCAALLSQSANAGECHRKKMCEPRHKHHYCHDREHPFFVTVGAGASFSADSKVSVASATSTNNSGTTPSTAFWDGANEGYNHNLDTSEFYTVALGYHWNDLFSTSVELTNRPSYKYRKTQTVGSTTNPQTSFSGIEGLGNKKRYFDLNSTSLTFNIDLRSGGIFEWASWRCGEHIGIQLILGGGIGVAYNKVENFHSISTSLAARTLVGRTPFISATAGGGVRPSDGNTDVTTQPLSPAGIAAIAGAANDVGTALGGAFNANDQVVLNIENANGSFNQHDVLVSGGNLPLATFPQAHSIMLDKTSTEFSWDVKVGIEIFYKRCSFDIFYRYNDAGKFRSNKYIIDAPINPIDPIAVPAWHGKVTAHELCFSLNKRF